MDRVTDVALRRVAETIRPGDVAIDATAGNGHDTVFLAKCVGPTGHVFACDLQADAIACTRQRLIAEGLANVTLWQASHAFLCDWLPQRDLGRVSVVMFNLGYLPGGDQARTTLAESTVQAIRASAQVVRPGGAISIVAYPGHPAGAVEWTAVVAELDELEERNWVVERPADALPARCPRFYFAVRPTVESCRSGCA